MKIEQYIIENFKENEPFEAKDIIYPFPNINQQLKRLAERNIIAKFQTGIYYIPSYEYGFKSVPDIYKLIRKKYLIDSVGRTIGFIGGYRLINELNLTTQFSRECEIYTNKATTKQRKIQIGSECIILKKPPVDICDENIGIIKFINVLENEYYFETNKETTDSILKQLINVNGVTKELVRKYVTYYPDKICRTLIERGIYDLIQR